MTTFYNKYDYDPEVTKEAITGESHTIPSSAPYDIFLLHVPRNQDPSTVTISDGGTTTWNEVGSEPAGTGDYKVRYQEELGRISFSSNDAGKSITVDYNACGTVVWAETHDDGREGIQKIQNAITEHEGATKPHTDHADKTGDTFTGTMTYDSGSLLKKTASGGTTYTIVDDDAKVHRAVYNDLAEFMNKLEDVEAGDVLVASEDENGNFGVKKCRNEYDKAVVGVYSDTYGFYLGGKNISEDENLKDNAPVGISGRVWVKAIGPIEGGDTLVPSDIPGVAMATKDFNKLVFESKIGKSLESLEEGDEKRIAMLIE